MKIRPNGVVLFHADRRTGGWTGRHDETNSRFLQFCERAKKTEDKKIEVTRRRGRRRKKLLDDLKDRRG
jgi:hypothetical protein